MKSLRPLNVNLFFCVFLFLLNVTEAQVLMPDATETYYSEMWNVYNSHKRINYIGFPWMNVNADPGVPILFEANISPYFTFFKGRDYGADGYSHPQLRSLLVYFNPELTMRMYREDPIGTPTKSLPVLPINFVPRLSIVKYLHRSSVENKVGNFGNYQFVEFTVAHYSNGQEDPHYLRGVVNPSGDSIANYRSGNFSTNYLKLGYTRGWMSEKYAISSANVYVQNDGGVGDLFSYDAAQEKSYGHWRAGLTLQYQSGKTMLYTKKNQKIGLRKVIDGKNKNGTDSVHFETIKQHKFRYYITWMVRWTNEFIVDNVSRYPSAKKNIYSGRLTFLAHPLNWRNVALLAEYYYGRDFYNIRFYDEVYQFKIGLVAEPSFFIPRNTYRND